MQPIYRHWKACMSKQPPPPACSWGPSPSTQQVLGSSPGPRRCTACAFFLHPPFLPPSGDSFFCTFPTNPAKVLGVNQLGIVIHLQCNIRKEELHLKPKLSMFCALSQNYQHFFEKKKRKCRHSSYFRITDQNMQGINLINESLGLLKIIMLFFEFLRMHILFLKECW